jgi:O-antigen/teichoic acid export membrane protein
VKPIRQVSWLSVAGAASGLSTLLVFLAVVAAGNDSVIAGLAMALAVSGLVAFLADGGTTGVAIRAVVRTDNPPVVLRRIARRRIAVGTALSTCAVALMVLLDQSVYTSVTAGLLAISTVAYGMAILAAQATSKSELQILCNSAKAATSVGLAVAIAVSALPPDRAVVGLALSLAFPAVFTFVRLRVLAGASAAPALVSPAVMAAAVGYGLYCFGGTLVVGWTGSDSLVAAFSANERVAFGAMAVTNALASVAYPTASRDSAVVRRWLSQLTIPRVALGTGLLVGAAAIAVTVLELLTGSGLYDRTTMALALVGYGAFAVTALPMAVLIAEDRLWWLAWSSLGQAGVVLAAAAVAGPLAKPWVAAAGICVASLLHFWGLMRLCATGRHQAAVGQSG